MSELSEQTMQKFTDDLIDCERKSVAYPNLTEIYPNGTVSQAYVVQQLFINKLAIFISVKQLHFLVLLLNLYHPSLF